jgi:farnesyl-diphosphate farnesyltransferase
VPPEERRRHVEALRAALRDEAAPDPGQLAPRLWADQPAAERELLVRLPDVLAAYRALPAEDRAIALGVLLTLTRAMLDALERFPSERDGRMGALETRAELDHYTYMNAGCVGEFWTDMATLHRPRCQALNVPLMRARAVRFGQALQLTNVLRDLPRDLRVGRCYLPRADLVALGLVPEDLLDPGALPRLRPFLAELLRRALADFREALAYTQALPRREVRLRLASAWPFLIGLATLARIARAPDLLDPAVTVKVPRRDVRRLLALSGLLIGSNAGLRVLAARLAAAAEP